MKKSLLNSGVRNVGGQIHRDIRLLAVCGLLLMASCKGKKPLIVNRAKADTALIVPKIDILAKLAPIKAQQISFNTFAAKASAKLDVKGSSNDVTLNIRVNQGKKIWVSVTAIAGIEVARALITPDSVMLINRLDNVYTREPFSYINSFAGSQVNYATLESLLVGNVIPELLNERTNFQANAGDIILSGNLQELSYKLVLGQDMKVTQTNLDNPDAGQSLQVINNIFVQAGGRVMPSQIDMVSFVKDKKIAVNLHYTKIDFEKPLEYPFSIPARYKKVR